MTERCKNRVVMLSSSAFLAVNETRILIASINEILASLWMMSIRLWFVMIYEVNNSRPSQILRTCPGAGPRPLEVVPPQPAGDVHHFANKVETRYLARFHGP